MRMNPKLTQSQMEIANSIGWYVAYAIAGYVNAKPHYLLETEFEKKILSDFLLAVEQERLWEKKRQASNSDGHSDFHFDRDRICKVTFFESRVKEMVIPISHGIAVTLVEGRVSWDSPSDEQLRSEEEQLTEIVLEMTGQSINTRERPPVTFLDGILSKLGYHKTWPKIFRETVPIEQIPFYWIRQDQRWSKPRDWQRMETYV